MADLGTRRRHRRTGRRRRRLVVAGALVVAVGLAVLAGVLLSGGGSSGSSAAGENRVAVRSDRTGSTSARPTTSTTTAVSTTTTTTAPAPPPGQTNPVPPTPRPADGTRPTVLYFGDSMSVNAAPHLKEQFAAAGYDVVRFEAFIGSSMCKDEPLINQALLDLRPQILVLQYEGNGSLFQCVDGYQPSYDLYGRALDGIGLNASFKGAPGGTKLVLVAPLPHADGTLLYPGSPGVADVFRDHAKAHPETFTFVDPATGLVPGPGALVACYPQEPGCRPDGRIQVRPDDHNPFDGSTIVGGGSHFCLDSTLVNLGEEDCNVPNAGGLRFAYNVVDGLRAAGL